MLYPPELRGHEVKIYCMTGTCAEYGAAAGVGASSIVTIFVTINGAMRSSMRLAASSRSPAETMLYRSKTSRVLCPVIIMATRSGTPARTRLRTAVRRKS